MVGFGDCVNNDWTYRSQPRLIDFADTFFFVPSAIA
jgi:hypothetical protein